MQVTMLRPKAAMMLKAVAAHTKNQPPFPEVLGIKGQGSVAGSKVIGGRCTYHL
jgi:hypothetical protein